MFERTVNNRGGHLYNNRALCGLRTHLSLIMTTIDVATEAVPQTTQNL